MSLILQTILATSLLEKLEKNINCTYKDKILLLDTKDNKYGDLLDYHHEPQRFIYLMFDKKIPLLRFNSMSEYKLYDSGIKYLLGERNSINKNFYLPTHTYEYILKRLYLWLKYKQAGMDIDDRKLLHIPEVLQNDKKGFVDITTGWSYLSKSFDCEDKKEILEFLKFFQEILYARKISCDRFLNKSLIMELYFEIIINAIERLNSMHQISSENSD